MDYPPLAGLRRRADIAFTRLRIAVFIDGCFWHGCPIHATTPKRNADYWGPKLAANVARDRDTDRRLEEAGWQVIRVWEHEAPMDAGDRIREAVRDAIRWNGQRRPAAEDAPRSSRV